jgi:hypothetical protein
MIACTHTLSLSLSLSVFVRLLAHQCLAPDFQAFYLLSCYLHQAQTSKNLFCLCLISLSSSLGLMLSVAGLAGVRGWGIDSSRR